MAGLITVTRENLDAFAGELEWFADQFRNGDLADLLKRSVKGGVQIECATQVSIVLSDLAEITGELWSAVMQASGENLVNDLFGYSSGPEKT